MTISEVDQRSPERRARDKQIAAEPHLAPLELPPDASLKPLETHLARRRRPLIVFDPDVLSGASVFAGTRVPIRNLFDYLAGGEPLSEFLEDFPSVGREQSAAAIREAEESWVTHARVLLDECVPKRLRRGLPGHDVKTATEMGWSGKKNGELLTAMSGDGFEVLLTVDQNLRHQQNFASSGIALIVLIGRAIALATFCH